MIAAADFCCVFEEVVFDVIGEKDVVAVNNIVRGFGHCVPINHYLGIAVNVSGDILRNDMVVEGAEGERYLVINDIGDVADVEGVVECAAGEPRERLCIFVEGGAS